MSIRDRYWGELIMQTESIRAIVNNLAGINPQDKQALDMRLREHHDEIFKARSINQKRLSEQASVSHGAATHWEELAELLFTGQIDEVIVNFDKYFPEFNPPNFVDD